MRNSALFPELIRATKLLHFNELEIAVWSLVLDYYNWKHPIIGREIFLYIIAFQAKVCRNKDCSNILIEEKRCQCIIQK